MADIVSVKPLRTWDVARWSFEEQMRLADIICVHNAENTEFVEKESLYLLQNPDWEKDFARWNVTSIGNAAYLSVHAPTAHHRLLYRSCLARYIDWSEQHYRTPFWIPVVAGLMLIFVGYLWL